MNLADCIIDFLYILYVCDCLISLKQSFFPHHRDGLYDFLPFVRIVAFFCGVSSAFKDPSFACVVGCEGESDYL